MGIPLRIFIIYAREDESFKSSLLSAFIPLRRAGKVEVFHDALIKPGDRWEDVILDNLRKAHIIMPLVSNDFFASEFIHEVEFKKAVDRYKKGETVIIPVILKHCGWKYDPIIKTLQVLPKDGKPVVTWAYHDEAWEQVLDAVHEVTEQVEEKNLKEVVRLIDLGLKEADFQEQIKHYSDSNAYPIPAHAGFFGGYAKYQQGQYAEAIKDYDQVIRLDPNYADAYINRGLAKRKLGQYAEAIKDYDQVIRFDPNDVSAYNNRGVAKENLGLFEDAKKDYQKSLNIDPNYEFAKNNLKRLKEKMKQNP